MFMQLLEWSYNKLIVPMMEDEQGRLFTTGAILCAALGITENALKKISQRHAQRFSWNENLTDCKATAAFLDQHRDAFGIKRLNKDIKLWSDADMINVAFLSNSPMAADFRDGVIELIRQSARKDYLSPEAFERIALQLSQQAADIVELRAELEGFRKIIARSQPALTHTAHAAGSALAAQRQLKNLRFSN
jgi:prophage antirepressor-like protein